MTKTLHTFLPSIFKKIHHPFKSIVPYELFSYLLVGVINTAFNIVLFYIFYYYLFEPLSQKGVITIFKPHSSALFLAFFVSAPIGYELQKRYVFNNNSNKKIAQFTKYIYVGLQAMFLDYVLLRLGIEYFSLEPMVAKIASTFLVVGITFFAQKYFTFK